MTHKSPIIVALDFSDEKKALEFATKIDPDLCRVKVGKELFTCCGPAIVEKLVARNFDVFLDLKFHDIPNTVANACRVAAQLGVWMLNVHALGGRLMMQAARDAIDSSMHKPLLIAVTILTSLSDEALHELGIMGSTRDSVIRLAKLAALENLDGVVCSAQEVSSLVSELTAEFKLVTPGIRPSGSEIGDQKRVLNPNDALRLGSHYLVIGRPITQAADPEKALSAIIASLD